MELQTLQNKKILIVDDSAVESDFIFSTLTPMGCLVSRAKDAHEAIKEMRSDVFDMVLLDIVLPDGSGYSILKFMLRSGMLEETPTIILSGLGNKEHIVKGLSMGAVDYVVKPFHPEELVRRIEIHLRIKATNENLKLELEQKAKIEAALFQQQQMFKDYFVNAPFMQIIAMPDCLIIKDVNATFVNDLGFIREDVIGKSSSEVFLSRNTQNDILQEIATSKPINNKPIEIRHINGTTKSGILTVTQYTRDKTIFLLFTIQDISYRTALEQKIKEDEETLYEIALNIPLPFIMTNMKDEITFINNKFTELFGYTRHDVPTVKALFLKAYPDETQREAAYRVWTRTLRAYDKETQSSLRKVEYRLTSKSGELHSVEIYITKNKDSNFIIFRDVTKEKNDLLEIRRLSEAIYQNPASIVITDQTGAIKFVNPKFSEVTGFQPEEVIGQNPRIQKSGMTPRGMYRDLWETILSGKTWQGEFINRKKTGEKYWEKAIIAPIFDEKRTIVNFIAIKEDITEKKRVIEDLVKSEQALKEANATKDKFFSIIAHDLRNPIGSIMNLSFYLYNNSEVTSELLPYIHHIYNVSTSTAALLEDLLNWARSQSGKLVSNPVIFDVGQEIDSTNESLKEQAIEKNITIELCTHPRLMAYGDPKLFKTVLRNLISNAIKFTREGGRVKVESTQKKDFIHVSVVDNGVGIEKERIPDLFRVDRNFSTPGTSLESGTGMGLPLCKEFVIKMGGDIWINSHPDKGTMVSFSLPVNQPPGKFENPS